MGYDNDFVVEEPVELDIEGRKFKYKPTTGGDENEWLKEVLVIDPVEKIHKIDWSEYNKKKLGNIKSVPYDEETIKKVTGKDKDWKNMTTDERYHFLGKLRPGMFDKLINEMKKVDEADIESTKN